MARKVSIKTYEDNNIHFDFNEGGQNYTLCGLETGGDEGLDIEISKPVTRKRVNCVRCILIVNTCKKIKRKEYK